MYCFSCGKKCISEEVLERYNERTGDPIIEVEWKCPTGTCGHRGHWCDWKEIPRSLRDKIFGAFLIKPDIRCTKCGAEKRDEE